MLAKRTETGDLIGIARFFPFKFILWGWQRCFLQEKKLERGDAMHQSWEAVLPWHQDIIILGHDRSALAAFGLPQSA